jgi:hypothetical protein
MSAELIPSNDLLGYAPMFDRHQILTSVALDEADRASATRYLERHAPDLKAMILGNAA